MGSSPSKPGVSANPRVVHADSFARKVNRDMRIDASVLVDVGHGSFRYRYTHHGNQVQRVASRREQPHSGDVERIKYDYFYHSRNLHQPTNDGLHNFQRFYVTKPPASSRNKNVFYVYGIGIKSQDGHVIKPSDDPTNRVHDYAWPEVTVK